MNKYLINEPPLFVLPTLAQKIGLNEAILVQQLHFWLLRSKNEKAGNRWVYNTYDDWLEQFPFWTKITLRRTVNKLEESGIVISTLEFNRDINKTKWYRLDYAVLKRIIGDDGLDESSEYLICEPPLIVLPTLAVQYGLNESMFLQQLQFYQTLIDKKIDGHTWIAKTYSSWLSQFTFWSNDTLARIIKKLTEQGLILNTNKYNSSNMEKTRWLSVLESVVIAQIRKTPNLQSEQTNLQSEQTNLQSEQSNLQSEQIVTANGADHNRKMSSPYIGSDYDPDYKTDYDRSSFKEVKEEITLTEAEVDSYTDKAVEYFEQYCINSRTIQRKTDTLKTIVAEAIKVHGSDALETIFEAVKRSDYLLGHTGTKPELTWILKNADLVLSGKYASRGDSKYEAAQKCNKVNFTCKPTTDTKKPHDICAHCPRWTARPEPTQPREKNATEIAMDCFKNTENAKHRDYICPVLGKRELRHEYCSYCPRQEEYLKQEAAICFEKYKGMCSSAIFKTEARECCRYCPRNDGNPDNTRIKKQNSNTRKTETITVDYSDNNDVWRAAHQWTIKNSKKINGFIIKYLPYLALDIEELETEALTIAVETIAPLAAEQPDVPERQFAAKFWNNLKYRFRQMQAIPSVGQIMNTKERTPCSMVDFNEIESYTNFNDPTNRVESEDAQKLLAIMGILTLEEEEIIEHRELGLKHGLLTAKETAIAMGISYDKQRKFEKSSKKKMSNFVKKYKITPSTKLETIKEHVAAEAKLIFKPLESVDYFELGNILKVI